MTTAIRIELHYLPSLAWFTAVLPFDTVWLEAAEHYQKQSYRNRCYVRSANGVERLTIPVQEGTHKQPIREVRIDTRQAWQDHHWRSLSAAYKKAPFFEYYESYFRQAYAKNWKYLFDVNTEMLTICLNLLNWKKEVSLTERFDRQVDNEIADGRFKLKGRPGDQIDSLYRPYPYLQNFGSDFAPNLSIIDLLFCQGPAAGDVLRRSRPE